MVSIEDGETDQSLTELFRILRKKCEWLTGFADALLNPRLCCQVSNLQELLNRYEKQHPKQFSECKGEIDGK